MIVKCLPRMTLLPQLSCPEDAECLERVAFCFEEYTLPSTLFQVSGSSDHKRKRTLRLKRHSEDHRCICDANMSVRMWTTSAEEVPVMPGTGNQKDCAFYTGSTHYRNLISVPDPVKALPYSQKIPALQAKEAQDKDMNGGSLLCTNEDRASTECTSDSTADLSPDAGSLSTRIAIEDAKDRTEKHNIDLSAQQTNTYISSSSGRTTSETEIDPHPPRNHNKSPTRRPPCLSPVGIECRTRPDLSSTSGERSSSNNTKSVPIVEPDASAAAQSFDLDSCFSRGNERHPQAARDGPCAQHLNQYHCQSKSPAVHQRPSDTRRPGRPIMLSMSIPERDPKFFGREEVLGAVEASLMPVLMPLSEHLTNRHSGSFLILHGIAGVGKSAMALEVIYRIQQQYDHIIWLCANNEVRLARSLHEAAISLGLVQGRGDYNHESSRQSFLDWLSSTKTKWLLVFDDADELGLIDRYIPKPRRGTIIVTTRILRQDLFPIQSTPGLRLIKLRPFDLGEAVAFLRSFLPDTFTAAISEAHLAVSMTIARRHPYLPFILRRLGTMLRSRNLPEDMVIKDIFERHEGGELFSQPWGPVIFGYLSPPSDALASVMTCLDPYQIRSSILLGAQRCFRLPLKYFPMTDLAYHKCTEELYSHALLRYSANRKYITVHRLTHDALRNGLNLIRFWQCLHSASRLLEVQWPSKRKMKNVVLGNWPEFDSLHTHVHQLAVTYARFVTSLDEIDYEELDVLNESLTNILLLSTW